FGTPVVLTATPNGSSQPVEWIGCPTKEGTTQCKVTMTSNQKVEAKFNLQQRQLTVTREGGTGTGKVMSSPAGIDCGSTCSANFDLGSKVVLTGTPESGSKAVEWTSCPGTISSNKCELTMGAAQSVKYKFELEQHFLKVTKEGNGS